MLQDKQFNTTFVLNDKVYWVKTTQETTSLTWARDNKDLMRTNNLLLFRDKQLAHIERQTIFYWEINNLSLLRDKQLALIEKHTELLSSLTLRDKLIYWVGHSHLVIAKGIYNVKLDLLWENTVALSRVIIHGSSVSVVSEEAGVKDDLNTCILSPVCLRHTAVPYIQAITEALLKDQENCVAAYKRI